MTNEEKIGIARILSDVVKADGQLSVEQFALAQEFHAEYHLAPEHIAQSRFITFCSALKSLKDLSRLEKKELIQRMKTVAYGNRVCNVHEAMLLTAMEYVLMHGVLIISAPTIERTLGGEITMTYMESEYNDQYNEELMDMKRYRLVRDTCKIEGIRFAYVPMITSSFITLDKQVVVNILRYMSPTLSEEEASNVGRRMGEITSSEFFLKVMHLPLQNETKVPREFLLISVGISMTPYCQADGNVKYFKEYLCLPIEGSVLQTVDKFIETYRSYVTVAPGLRQSNNAFYDFSFYKLFFDFLLTPPPVMPDLIFLGQEPKTGKYAIALRFGENMKRITLTPKEYDAFYEIVEKTLHSKSKGLPIGLERTNLAPVISHIRQKITTELPEIALAERFKPERTGNVYTVHMEDTKVYVRKYKGVDEWKDELLSY